MPVLMLAVGHSGPLWLVRGSQIDEAPAMAAGALDLVYPRLWILLPKQQRALFRPLS